jgi:hypothetical protein
MPPDVIAETVRGDHCALGGTFQISLLEDLARDALPLHAVGSLVSCLMPSATRSFSASMSRIFALTLSPLLNALSASSLLSSHETSDR